MPNQPGRLYQGVDVLLFALNNCHGLMGVKINCVFSCLPCCRYCKRNAFSPLISTTGKHLTIVYKSKNLNRRSYWWIVQPLIYGFNASYSSRKFDSKYLSRSVCLLLSQLSVSVSFSCSSSWGDCAVHRMLKSI